VANLFSFLRKLLFFSVLSWFIRQCKSQNQNVFVSASSSLCLWWNPFLLKSRKSVDFKNETVFVDNFFLLMMIFSSSNIMSLFKMALERWHFVPLWFKIKEPFAFLSAVTPLPLLKLPVAEAVDSRLTLYTLCLDSCSFFLRCPLILKGALLETEPPQY
jgi:hypothetical protein